MEKEVTPDLIQNIVESALGESWNVAPFPHTYMSLYDPANPKKRNLYLRIEQFEGTQLLNYVENEFEIDFDFEGTLEAQIRREINKMKDGMVN